MSKPGKVQAIINTLTAGVPEAKPSFSKNSKKSNKWIYIISGIINNKSGLYRKHEQHIRNMDSSWDFPASNQVNFHGWWMKNPISLTRCRQVLQKLLPPHRSGNIYFKSWPATWLDLTWMETVLSNCALVLICIWERRLWPNW